MPTYHTTTDLNTGDVLTETWVDEVKANLDGLVVKPAARVYSGTAIPTTNETVTALSFSAERFDTDNLWAADNPTRLTIQTGGIYTIGAAIAWPDNNTGSRFLEVRLNGSIGLARQRRAAQNESETAINTLFALTPGDYLEVTAFQNSGGTLTIPTVNGAGQYYSPEMWAVWQGLTAAP